MRNLSLCNVWNAEQRDVAFMLPRHLSACVLVVTASALRPASMPLVSRLSAAATLAGPRQQGLVMSAAADEERAVLLARARERHAQTERALRPPPPPPKDADTIQDSTETAGVPGERQDAATGPSSFGIPSSRLQWVAVFGPLTIYALLGFAGYGVSIAAAGTAVVEAYKVLSGAGQ